MTKLSPILKLLLTSFVMMGVISCTGSQKLSQQGFQQSEKSVSKIIGPLPNYQDNLNTIKGKGRAIVSEPGNTERVILRFSSNRSRSLVSIRNGIGIKGGQLLTDGDTLTVYNKIDKYVRKIPIRSGNLRRINRLASINILDIINYSVKSDHVAEVLENSTLYQLRLTNGTDIYVDKQKNVIRQVIESKKSTLPYSKITYDAYTSVEGFTLPRRISIFGSDKKSKIALQLTSLELNPTLEALYINIPDDIPIYYR